MKHFDFSTILLFKDLSDESLWKMFKGKHLFGLIGNPVSKSVSHVTHNQIFKTLNFPAHFFRIHLEENELELAIPLLQKRGFLGLAVTMPFKEKIVAGRAINTLLLQEGRTENTDALAIEKLLLPFFTSKTHVSVLGAGGCAKGAIYVLDKHHIPFTVYNRTIKSWTRPLDEFHSPPGNHIVINTTSVGMEPEVDACPIDPSQLSSETIVFDAIYRPLKTKLLLAAEARGLKTLSGFDMFVWQAIFQMRLFLPISFEEKSLFATFMACQKTNFSPSFV